MCSDYGVLNTYLLMYLSLLVASNELCLKCIGTFVIRTVKIKHVSTYLSLSLVLKEIISFCKF